MKKLLQIVLFIVVGVIIFVVCLIVIFPKDAIKSVAEKELQQAAGLVITETGLKKLLPVGIEMSNASVIHEGSEKPIMDLDTLRMRLELIYLFMGKVKITLDGNKGDGSVNGEIVVTRKYTMLRLWAKAMEVKNIPYLTIPLGNTAGLSGNVAVAFAEETCPSGTIVLEGKDIDASGFKISGFPLSLGEGAKATLSAEFKDCKVNIKGLWFESKGFSANVQGDITFMNPYTKSSLALTLELMPNTSFMKEGSYLLHLLANYRKSSNYYLLKIKGTIENPILSQ